jgi:hypothetical protein
MYAWRPEISGRKVRCTCGTVLVAPEQSPEADDDLYALADAPAPVKPGKTVPAKVGEGAVARPSPLKVQPVAYREESTTAGAGSHVSEYFPDRVRDLYLPIGLIGFGTIVEIIASYFFPGPRGFSLVGVMRELCVDLFISTSIMLVAILLAAKLRQIDFGKLPVAILKLSAVVVGTIGVSLSLGTALAVIPFLGIILWMVLPLVCIYTLIGALFNLDESDTGYTATVMIGVWLLYVFLIRPMI